MHTQTTQKIANSKTGAVSGAASMSTTQRPISGTAMSRQSRKERSLTQNNPNTQASSAGRKQKNSSSRCSSTMRLEVPAST